jgi:hypothetical protein
MDKLPTQPNTPHPSQKDQLVSMLGVIAVQIEAALRETNAPAETLVQTVHSMSKATQTLARCIFDFSGSPARVFQDLMVLHDELDARSVKAVSAIQFHDRLVQCLTHVFSSLAFLSEFISAGNGPKSVAEWDELRQRIRGIHSMEQERVLFDLLNRGASADEKEAALAQKKGGGAGKVELF